MDFVCHNAHIVPYMRQTPFGFLDGTMAKHKTKSLATGAWELAGRRIARAPE
jgi:hypothetical protein